MAAGIGVRSAMPAPRLVALPARAIVQVRAAAFKPATVAETKAKFLEAYKKPIPSIYNAVVQELLVQMHFIRYSIHYEYSEVMALGFVSVYDQIMESLPEEERGAIFAAYVGALNEDAAKFREDASKMEQQASALPGPDALTPDASGTDLQKALARCSERAASGVFAYNKFVAIGLFRLLELTGAKEPAALEKLVKAVGVKPEAVNKDLMLYKGILSKLSAAKELMKEFLIREKRKQAEREAEKAAKAEKEKAGAVPAAA
ncbi:protein THYLAKOID FORMATION 1, chloroplastic, partial [Haematococcus lacustris]